MILGGSLHRIASGQVGTGLLAELHIDQVRLWLFCLNRIGFLAVNSHFTRFLSLLCSCQVQTSKKPLPSLVR